MPKKEDLIVSGFCAPRSVHGLLRDAARGKQKAEGGRVSASAIIVELVRRHEDELREMAKGRVK